MGGHRGASWRSLQDQLHCASEQDGGEQQRYEAGRQALLERGAKQRAADRGDAEQQPLDQMHVAIDSLEGCGKQGDEDDRRKRGSRCFALAIAKPEHEPWHDDHAPSDAEQPAEQAGGDAEHNQPCGSVGEHRRHTRGVSPAATLLEALEPLRSDPSRCAVLLDIDGTLAPIVRHAADAHVPEATRTLLIEIGKRYGIVSCVSGRRSTSARQIVAIGSIAYVGNHGGELLRPGATSVEVDPELDSWTDRVQEFTQRAFTREHERLRIRSEEKGAVAALHWRGAPDEEAASAAVKQVAELAEREGFKLHWGRKVLEIRPPIDFDKGKGIVAMLRDTAERAGGAKIAAALYVGDDMTDLDAFRGLRSLVESGELGLSVCAAVASEEARPELLAEADLTVDGESGVRGLLEALL